MFKSRFLICFETSDEKTLLSVEQMWCVVRFGTTCNLKYVKSTHGGVLLLVKLQASACNFTKSNTPPWVFFTFLKLYKWYQIAQRITNSLLRI